MIKSSTAFGQFLQQKQCCFWSIFGTKAAAAAAAAINQSINQSINESLSLVSVVQSGHVIPFFASTEPKEFN